MKIKTILMDLDGTVYRGSEKIEGSLETINFIREKGINLFFFTNNSEKNRTQIAEKLNNMGIDCDSKHIVNSGYITTDYIKKMGYKKVYLSGSESLKQEFINEKIDLTDETETETLVIGMDSTFNYEKLKKAVNAAINAKTIIACNIEKIFPCENGKMCPGNGAFVSAIEYASGKKTDIIIGKPNTPMLNYVMKITNSTPSEIMVVGDVYESDIGLADRCGAIGVLIGYNKNCPFCIDSIIKLPDLINDLIQYDTDY